MIRSTTTYRVIGYPFAFVWATLPNAPDAYLRCYPDVLDEKLDEIRHQHFLGRLDSVPQHYDLHFKRTGEDDEIFEDGWYLSGIGHHLLWCGADVADAADAAQEHIAWDGRDPHGLDPRPPLHEDRPHALVLPDSVWEDEALWPAYFLGRKHAAKKDLA